VQIPHHCAHWNQDYEVLPALSLTIVGATRATVLGAKVHLLMKMREGVDRAGGADNHVPTVATTTTIRRPFGVIGRAMKTNESIPALPPGYMDDRFVELHATTLFLLP
jgi:hypothetical protein